MQYSVVNQLRGGLIVSCQAGEDSALHGPAFMGAMAQEAEKGGAAGLRVDGAPDIHAARHMTQLPIIGINKQHFAGFDPYITVTFELAKGVVDAGADLIAMDGTGRPYPGNIALGQLIARIHRELNVPVMADVSTLSEGIAAEQAGADIIATTMSGYTPYSRRANAHTPDFELLRELVAAVHCPIIVEGRVTMPEQVRACLDLGAHAVCIGGAITNPRSITERFVEATRK